MPSKLSLGLQAFGLEPAKSWKFLVNIPGFARDAYRYAAISKGGRFPLRLGSLHPMLTDRDDQAGRASGDYFHQDLWAARKVFKARPAEHVDIGSRIDGFVSHLLAFMPVKVIDIRPLQDCVTGLMNVQADATNLTAFADRSVESLSSLHAIEHFGLGRYGDPIDPDAWYKAARSMVRVLRPGGRLYFSVPVGRERVEFNAQRVFSPLTVLDVFKDLELVSFAAVLENGNLSDPSRPEDLVNVRRACGLFEFTRAA